MWRKRLQNEEGIALIYVLFATVVISGLVVVFMSRILFETRSTAQSRDFESAIHVSEAGAESLFGAINSEGEAFADKAVTEDPDGNDHVYDVDTTLPDDQLQAAEEQWALDLAQQAANAEAAGTNSGTRLVDTVDGQGFGIRPKKNGSDEALDMVFGVGFVPSADAPDPRVRVVKMRIARRYFSPDHAILTGNDLKMGGNAEIRAPGCDPSIPETCNADVHANGNFDAGGSPLVQGDVTASGTMNPPNTEGGTSAGGEEKEPVPEIAARDFYNRDVTYNADPGEQVVEWFDLCPDGTVREPGTTPCHVGNTQVWPTNTDTSTRFRGWSYQSGTNTWEAKKVEAGIFYVYRADAAVNGSAGDTPRAVTILTETDSTSATTASKSGSLEMAGNPSLVSALPDTLFIADRDIKLKGTANGGQKTCDPVNEACDEQNYSGFISAGEQIDVSGTVHLEGSMISRDAEELHNLVQRSTAGINGTMVLTYDEDLKINLTGRITVEYWNEF